jgi:hypothetical protein
LFGHEGLTGFLLILKKNLACVLGLDVFGDWTAASQADE